MKGLMWAMPPSPRILGLEPLLIVLDRISTGRGDFGSESPVRSNAADRQITLALVAYVPSASNLNKVFPRFHDNIDSLLIRSTVQSQTDCIALLLLLCVWSTIIYGICCRRVQLFCGLTL